MTPSLDHNGRAFPSESESLNSTRRPEFGTEGRAATVAEPRAIPTSPITTMNRRQFVTLMASLAPAGYALGRPAPSLDARRKALRYLVDQQSADGSWKSRVYGGFQTGAALTPLVTRALAPHEPDAAEAGVGWLLEHREESLAAYPVHNACYMLQLAKTHRRLKSLVKPLCQRLRDLQLGTKLGWPKDHRAFGGWGYFGMITRWTEGLMLAPMQESNLSPSVFAVAGLRAGGVGPDDPALAEARAFIRICQNYAPAGEGNKFDDGGFFQMVGDPHRSKAGIAGTDAAGRQRLRSYTAATSDGLRGLVMTGAKKDAPRVLAAAKWLRAHPALNDVAHLEFYSAYVRRETEDLIGTTFAPAAPAAPAAAHPFSIPQDKDGSWRNPAGEYREDDPLIATAMAVMALGNDE
jgi:hypothetical protein